MSSHSPAPAADPGAAPPEPAAHQAYIPGYVVAKVLIIVIGMALVTLAMLRLGPAFAHLLVGARAEAEATRVVRMSMNGSEEAFATDGALEAVLAQDKRGRTHTYWNEFRFLDAAGRPVDIRAPVGSFLKPHYPILDKDGLPTTVVVWYDRADPRRFTLPGDLVTGEFSTWFFPGSLLIAGMLTVWFGATLLYYARRPIAMPDLRAKPGTTTFARPG